MSGFLSLATVAVGPLRSAADRNGAVGGHVALWVVAILGGLVLMATVALVVRVLRRRRRIGAEMVQVFAHVASALDDPLLVHQARRRIRQAGDR